METKIRAAIEALNGIITEDTISLEPRRMAKINTMKRYLLAMLQSIENKQNTNN